MFSSIAAAPGVLHRPRVAGPAARRHPVDAADDRYLDRRRPRARAGSVAARAGPPRPSWPGSRTATRRSCPCRRRRAVRSAPPPGATAPRTGSRARPRRRRRRRAAGRRRRVFERGTRRPRAGCAAPGPGSVVERSISGPSARRPGTAARRGSPSPRTCPSAGRPPPGPGPPAARPRPGGVAERAVAQLPLGVIGQRHARSGRVEQERVAAGRAQHRVVADQRPVAAGHGAVLLVEPVAHLDAVRDAVAVGDDQRRPVVRLRLAERTAASAAGRRPSRPGRRTRSRRRSPAARGPSSAIVLPAAANLATAPSGVALDDWPPVLE